MDIRPEVLDELLAAADDPTKLFGADGLVAALTARLVERVTDAELDSHLRDETAAGRKNTRNGRTQRKLLSGRGTLDVSMPSPPEGGDATAPRPSSRSWCRSTCGACPTLTRRCCFTAAACRRATSRRITRLLGTLTALFPDYDGNTQFTFSKTGRTLPTPPRWGGRERLLCPYRITRLGQTRLLAMLRRRVPGVKTATGERLITAAEASVRSAPPRHVADVLSDRLAVLVAELEMHEAHAEVLRTQIEALGQALKADGALPPIDEAVSGLTLFNMARLVGQTGPLADFASKRQLLRYTGMNLRERESGTYRGQTRLSKKGRPMLRKVLVADVTSATGRLPRPSWRPSARRALRGALQPDEADAGDGGGDAQAAHGRLGRAPQRGGLRPCPRPPLCQPVRANCFARARRLTSTVLPPAEIA